LTRRVFPGVRSGAVAGGGGLRERFGARPTPPPVRRAGGPSGRRNPTGGKRRHNDPGGMKLRSFLSRAGGGCRVPRMAAGGGPGHRVVRGRPHDWPQPGEGGGPCGAGMPKPGRFAKGWNTQPPFCPGLGWSWQGQGSGGGRPTHSVGAAGGQTRSGFLPGGGGGGGGQLFFFFLMARDWRAVRGTAVDKPGGTGGPAPFESGARVFRPGNPQGGLA